jgi:hypothetical protein
MTPRIQQALEKPVSPGAALHAWDKAEERLFMRKNPPRKWSASITTNGFKSFKATITRKS